MVEMAFACGALPAAPKAKSARGLSEDGLIVHWFAVPCRIVLGWARLI
jgi:hypothetical protein